MAALTANMDAIELDLGMAQSHRQALEDQWKKTLQRNASTTKSAVSASATISSTVVAQPVAPAQSDECVVCMERQKRFVVVPCGHHCLCETCVGAINGVCPVCRGAAASTLKVF